jgi:hypothetical protein
VPPVSSGFSPRSYVGDGEGAATFYVTPQDTNLTSIKPLFNKTGQWFSIQVRIANHSHVAWWQVKLIYKTALLSTTGANIIFATTDNIFRDMPIFAPTKLVGAYNATWSYAMFGCGTMPLTEAPGRADDGLVTIWFQILADPDPPSGVLSTMLYFNVGTPYAHLTYTLDYYMIENDCTMLDGYYENRYAVAEHDVAVTNLSLSSNVAGQGLPMYMNVTVVNAGVSNETFDLAVLANGTVFGLQTINLTSLRYTIVAFTWNTTGVPFGTYEIRAIASIVLGENLTDNNIFVDGTVLIIPSIHDVAITGVAISNNYAYQGGEVEISVDAWNVGAYPETFNITTYADKNSTIIGDEITIGIQLISLPTRDFTTLAFIWNTTGVAPGNYTVSGVADNITGETDLTDNIYVNGKIEIFASIACYEINITSPTHIELNPAIFQFNWTVRALEFSLGNMTIVSTGYEGLLRVLGSTNGTIHLRVDQPHLEFANYYLPKNGTIQVPLWLLFDPGTYSGTYELQMTVCGVHKLKLTIDIVHIWICRNGVYSVAGGTATFNWTVTGGSWVYLEAQPNLPPGWSFTVDPPIGTLFETPHQVMVNITAAPDAKEGDIGSVTLRAYKNGTNILIWQFIFFSSLDNKPPTIEKIKPPTLTFKGDLLFNATVRDASGIEGVQLYYSIDHGPWNNQSMQWNSGDTFNSTSYIVAIPHLPSNSEIDYYVVANDWLRNQTQTDIQTITIQYDLAIAEVKAGKTVVGQGFTTQINVTLANQGTIPNTSLKIFVYANTTVIHTQIIPSLTNGTAATISFQWKTTNLPKGNYKITAHAVPLLGETSITDNTCAGGTILVTIPGDVNGDKYVEGKDIALIAKCFDKSIGQAGYVPNADVNGDGTIEGKDIATAAKNFDKQWT